MQRKAPFETYVSDLRCIVFNVHVRIEVVFTVTESNDSKEIAVRTDHHEERSEEVVVREQKPEKNRE
jgi:hypothetical protein